MNITKRLLNVVMALVLAITFTFSEFPFIHQGTAMAQTTKPNIVKPKLKRKPKPNIVVIMGDDIGWFNLSAYNRGIMGYKTPRIDSIAEEGMLFTDAYGEQSCTAGRAAFITGQSPARTGLTKVGLPGVPIGLSEKDPTLAELLKDQGYTTGQFGKNHLGDLDEFLPTNHGFDIFYGNLYHLNAEEEPENPDYPQTPKMKPFRPRGVIRSFASDYPHQNDFNNPPCETKKIQKPITPAIYSPPICSTGPLTIERMKTIDQDFLDNSLKFVDHAVTDQKPFFLWFNSTRTHIFTHLKDKSENVTGQGIYADGIVEHDQQVGQLLDKIDDLGIKENTIVIYTTDNGAEVFSCLMVVQLLSKVKRILIGKVVSVYQV